MRSQSFLRGLITWFSVLLLAVFTILLISAPSVLADEQTGYGTIIGIDLGTTYSRVSFAKNGLVEIIPNDLGCRHTPSWVSFTDDQILVGDVAKSTYHNTTTLNSKHLIGRRFEDPDAEKELDRWPCTIADEHGRPSIEAQHQGENMTFTPEDISAILFQKMKETAEAYLEEKITHAVVPVYFNDGRRQAIKNAGAIAGLKILRVINEPTAAAIAYGLDKKQTFDDEGRALVYDLGGGTFDVTLLSVDDGVFEVLASAGDTNLGGEVFDDRVRDHMVERYKNQTGIDISKDPHAFMKLKREAEKAKRTLSSQLFTKLKIEPFENGNNFSETLTRAEFEEINKDLFERTIVVVQQVLKDCNITKEEIDDVIPIGGSSNIPKVQALLKDFFNGKESLAGINPNEAVAWGAALQGAILSGDDGGGEILGNFDICHIPFGIETSGGIFTTIIPTYSIIPITKTQTFTADAFLAAEGDQSAVTIQIYSGGNVLTKDCNHLGQLVLSGVLPEPNGISEIDVSIKIDANFDIWVKAIDRGSGNSESTQVFLPTHLTAQEIDRMVEEAEMFANEEAAKNEKIETLESLQHHLRIKKRELGDVGGLYDEVSDEIRENFSAAVKKVDDWIEENESTADANAYREKLLETRAIIDPIVAEARLGRFSPKKESSIHHEL
ncbi:ATPase with role in protein import into the ER [Tulasnella sp. JGI-2019a]|nr:ATPase with role in protein import into the ER [Tulasnella sp. JGI-2019a]